MDDLEEAIVESDKTLDEKPGIEGVNEADHQKTGASKDQVWKEEESQMEK